MIAFNLRAWLDKNGMSTVDLAKSLNCDRATVYRWTVNSSAPDDIEERLAKALAFHQLPVDPAGNRVDRSCPDDCSPSSEVPHGTVIGLTRRFWMDYTDAERVAYVMSADNPFLALPWPWWTHGWTYWPPSQLFPERFKDNVKPAPAEPLPHWLDANVERAIRSKAKGDPLALRHEIIRIMRKSTPTWFKPVEPMEIGESELKSIL